MKTEIFANYAAFIHREDRSVNGVSEAFAKANPNYQADNSTNARCWECTGCTGCSGCANCKGCTDCTGCFHCTDCRECVACYRSSESVRCSMCRGIISRTDCDQLKVLLKPHLTPTTVRGSIDHEK